MANADVLHRWGYYVAEVGDGAATCWALSYGSSWVPGMVEEWKWTKPTTPVACRSGDLGGRPAGPGPTTDLAAAGPGWSQSGRGREPLVGAAANRRWER